MILCALFFQTVEYKPSEGNGEGKINVKNVMKNLTSRYNISEIQASEIIQRTLKAASDDQYAHMRASWKEFARAFWFVTIVFTTVGKFDSFPFTHDFIIHNPVVELRLPGLTV